jgi:hypothetical protein
MTPNIREKLRSGLIALGIARTLAGPALQSNLLAREALNPECGCLQLGDKLATQPAD